MMSQTRTRRIVFSSLLCATALAAPVRAQQTLPTPQSVLGFAVGADFHLARYDEAMAYFEALAAASDRVQLREVGRTSEGQPWYMALISSPQNLARVDEYREIARRLASPEGDLGDDPLSDEEARELARRGKALVHIDGGLHATEVAHAQHTIQLAYDLASSQGDPEIDAILDEVILMLWPSVNPDGQNIVVDWYRSNVGGAFEVAPLPELYQKYVGHDNNRDGYMLNMIESRVLARTWREWEPQVIYVHHQSSPFPTRIWLPPFAEPIASRVHPLMSRTVNAVGMLIAQGLEERGQVGATHMGTGFDAWYPGYVDYMPMLRNVAAWFTETALYRYATPHFYTLADFPESRRDLRSESLYPSPWRGGWWRLRDAVEYMLTASVATLDYAAKYRFDLLYNRYQAGRDTIRKYRDEPPYAYFLPADQGDPVAVVELLRRLAFNGARVHRLRAAVEYEGQQFAAGTWTILMDQEDAELVRQVMEVQRYPDLREFPDGPPEQPYDAAGWTLPMQMGVRAIAGMTPVAEELRAQMEPLRADPVAWSWPDVDNPETATSLDRSPFDSVPGIGFDTDPVAAAIVPAGAITGNGAALHVSARQNNAYRAVNRTWAAGGEVRLDAETDSFVLGGLTLGQQQPLVDELALVARRGALTGTAVRPPRVAMYRPWTASMDEGWSRWVLERYEFEFSSLRDAEVRAGDLGSRYDVIVLPDISARSIEQGYPEGTMPARFAGGLGSVGLRALTEFVRAGGTLVCLNSSTALAIDLFGLPVTNVVADLGREEFFAGISLLEVERAASDPLTLGMRDGASITVSRSPVFDTGEEFEGQVLLRYPAGRSALMSGYLLGDEHLRGKAAALVAPAGAGRAILLGFRPQWRGQPFGTFRVLFNAILDLPAAPAMDEVDASGE